MPARRLVFNEEQVASKEKEITEKIDSMLGERLKGESKPQKFIGTIHTFGMNRGSIYVELHPTLGYLLFHLKPAAKGRMRSEKLASLREAALRILKHEALKK